MLSVESRMPQDISCLQPDSDVWNWKQWSRFMTSVVDFNNVAIRSRGYDTYILGQPRGSWYTPNGLSAGGKKLKKNKLNDQT